MPEGGASRPVARVHIFAIHTFLSILHHSFLRGRTMHKEELITLHQMMVEIKEFFEKINPELKFSQYYALKIDPSQVHRSKMEHKYAIFILGTELANAMRDVEFGASGRISARMRELAEKTLKEIENLK
jgi:hypothetical protein